MRNSTFGRFIIGFGGFVALSALSLGCEVVHEKSGEWPEPNGANLIENCEGNDEACAARKAYVEKKYKEPARIAADANREFQKQYGVSSHGHGHDDHGHDDGHGHDHAAEGEAPAPDSAPADAAPAPEGATE